MDAFERRELSRPPLLWQVLNLYLKLDAASLYEESLVHSIHMDPTILKRGAQDALCGKGRPFELFRSIFELGMRHYPKDMGFLFSSYHHPLESPRNKTTSFETACELFGTERVIEAVGSIIWKNVQGRSDGMTPLVVAAASDSEIVLDGLHFLVRLDPSQRYLCSTEESVPSRRSEIDSVF